METPISSQANNTKEEKNGEQLKEVHHHHYPDRKKGPRGKFFWGIILVFVGLIMLARSIGIFPDLEFSDLFIRFWPVLVILFGLSIISRSGWFSTIVAAILGIGVLGAVMLFSLVLPERGGMADQLQPFVLPIDNSAEILDLRIKFGAGRIILEDSDKQEVSGQLRSNFLGLETDSDLEGRAQIVTIRADSNFSRMGWRHLSNNLQVAVPKNLSLILDVDAGAADLNLDLKEINLQELTVDTGASNLDLFLGQIGQKSLVKIRAGASSINITLPKDIGVRLSIDSGLSSKSLADLKKIDDRTYESDNYASASSTIDLTMEIGVSSLQIERD